MKENKKALVITGLPVEKLKDLKKEYMKKYNKSISYNTIIGKLILNASLEDVE